MCVDLNLTPDISVVNLQLVDHSCLNGERFIHRLIIATEMKPKMAWVKGNAIK